MGIIGGIVMSTKEKKHWLYVDYKGPAGLITELVLRLDKSEREGVLVAVKSQTGRDVELLPEEDVPLLVQGDTRSTPAQPR